jgi:o-succinylbenzoate---CoA ligase
VTSRPLHAVLVSPARPGAPLLDALPAALDGTGPALLPLDASLPGPRLRALLRAFAPSVVLTSEGPERTAGGRSPASAGPGVRPETALVIATSGSTGEPKGVELAGSALLASARASLRRIGATRGERWLCCLPAFHIAGIQVLVRSQLCGTTPTVPDRLDAAALAASGCAHVSLVPTQLRRLVDAAADLSALSSILLGGAAVPPGLLDAARDAGGKVITTYGMTETCGGCVYDGVPLDGVSADIRADGRIRIAGPVLFSGYRLRPDLTARAREGDWFVTSDLGAITPSGALVVRGRADDVINTGGELVVAAEVENALGSCAGVREAAVVGVADPEWGERVTAVVVPADPGAPPRLDALRAHVSGVLPAYAAPGALVLVDKIPMLPSGKPDREALRARLG